MVIILVLIFSACTKTHPEEVTSSTSSPTTVQETEAPLGAELNHLIAEVDRLITMFPGSGPGPRAERLATNMGGEAIPGTASHLATANLPGGVVDIVSYQATAPEPERNGRMFCVAEISPNGGGAGCGGEPILEPQAGSGGWSDGPGGHASISAFGGEDARLAILTTDKGSQIGILTTSGWVYAEWPTSWGLPDQITFYDALGTEGFRASYDWMR